MGSRPNLSNSTGDVSRTGSTDSGAGSGSGSPNQARKITTNSTVHTNQPTIGPLPIARENSTKDGFANFGSGPGPGTNLSTFNPAVYAMEKQHGTGALGKIYASLAHTGSNHNIRQKSDM